MKSFAVPVLISLFTAGCGIYTFSGSSIPSHLKTVDLPLMENQSMEPDIADDVSRELNRQILENNLLRIVSEDGDATISGSITGYLHEPYTYGASSTREVDVNQYIVKITADVQFLDNTTGTPLFKGSITGQGIYDFQKETEDKGKEIAMQDLIQRILQNSLQSW